MAFRPESVEVSVGKPASDEGLVKKHMVLPSHASQTFIFFRGEMVKSGRCNVCPLRWLGIAMIVIWMTVGIHGQKIL